MTGRHAPERWWQIDQLFAAALERDEGERDAFVRGSVGDDRDLADEVLALLQASTDAERVLGESAVAFAEPLIAGDTNGAGRNRELPSGSRVGHYQIIREIGRGGMGAVYLARRADREFEKQVALKVVKRGMDTDEILARFRQERQILASLEHEGIARLYDGGATADGRPYLVMEYVDGKPLTDFCDGAALSVERRLALFIEVCQAVQAAHQRLIVHRDLKPSNILITAAGRVKLLDFGLARLLDAGDGAPHTTAGSRILTPEYAAPEQILGGLITTATDVYALGAVLYQLLTGQRPVQPISTDRALALQELIDREPAPASRAAAATDIRAAAARRATPAQLRQRLHGDLDAIIARALEKEPGRRYPSPGALADDIARHLEHQPVTARPATSGYRIRRFVHRHRGRVALAAGLLTVVACGVVYAGLRITRERDLARLEASKAEAATAFLTQLFYDADTDATLGDTLTIGELLERGATRINSLADQPAVQATVQSMLGDLYHRFGDLDRAGTLLEQSLVTRQRLDETARGDVASSMFRLADLWWQQGRVAAAESLFAQTINATRSRLGSDAPELAQMLNRSGFMLVILGRYAEARPRIAGALQVLRAAGPEWRKETATAVYVMATIDMQEGKLAAAEAGFREALAMARAALGPVSTRGSDILVELGVVLIRRRRFAEAESVLQAGLDQRQLLLGPDHRFTAIAMHNLAAVLRSRARFGAADSLYGSALRIFDRAGVSGRSDVARALTGRGWSRMLQGDLPAAEEQIRAGLALMEQVEGPGSSGSALPLAQLAEVLRRRGREGEAEATLREALALQTRVHGDGSLPVAAVQWSLADLLRQRGQLTEAEALFATSLGTRQRELGLDSATLPQSWTGFAQLRCAQRRTEEGDSLLRQAAALQDRLGDETGEQLRQIRVAQAACAATRGRPVPIE